MEWFKSLDDREQAIVGMGGVLILLCLIYLLVWEPLSSAYKKEKKLSQTNQELSVWMQQSAADIRQLRSGSSTKKPRIAAQSLLSTLDSSAKQAGLSSSIKQMKPKGKNGIQVKLEGVSFDKLISWIHSANSRYGIEATSISTESTSLSGRVNSRITFEIHE